MSTLHTDLTLFFERVLLPLLTLLLLLLTLLLLTLMLLLLLLNAKY